MSLEKTINWDDPKAVEAAVGIPELGEFGESGDGIDIEEKCNGICSDCMQCPIDDIGTKLSSILCCKSHPETGEVDEETGACPNYDMPTGECKIYDTHEYPAACENYHCKTHGR